MDTELQSTLAHFFSRLADPAYIFNTDKIWTDAAREQLEGKDPEFRIRFWTEIEKHLKEHEKRVGHIHKGDIYWYLAMLFLGQGDLTKTIEYLDLSTHEDHLKGDSFSAAIGLSSVLKPLVYRFRKTKLEFDEEIMGFYESLSPDEKREFAELLNTAHRQVVKEELGDIQEEFSRFVVDPTIRRMIRDSYVEMKDILSTHNLSTYFSCLFSAGSILDGLVDDLFSQHNQQVWRQFHANPEIQKELERDQRLRRPDYDPNLFLGKKIKVLRLLAEHGTSPIPKVSILQMLIIGEYRNLIHTKRRTEFVFEVNWYVAAFIFWFINQIASHWSSEHR